MKMLFNLQVEKFWQWLAWKLPRRLAYWACVRVMIFASSGKYGNQNPMTVSVSDIMSRWEE